MVDFNKSIGIVLKHEGGYANVRYDKGGATKYGISQARYPNLDIENLSLQAAKDIYFRDFWKRFRINELNNQDIADFSLDTVVHHGKGVMLLQQGLNKSGRNVSIDNRIGPQTIGALNNVNPTTFVNNAVKARTDYMHSLVERDPTQQKFLKGWLNRANSFKKKAITSLLPIAIIGVGVYWYLRRKKS
jgi:lysozyme family protein